MTPLLLSFFIIVIINYHGFFPNPKKELGWVGFGGGVNLIASTMEVAAGVWLNVGSGPQLNAGGVGGDAVLPEVLFSGTDWCFLTVAPAPRRPDGGVDGWKLSSGSVQLGTVGSGVPGNNGPVEAGKPKPDGSAFCGVLNATGGAGATAALVLRSGSLRTDNSARFSLWAERSAFRAAAVVIATWGVTLYGRRETGSGRRGSRDEVNAFIGAVTLSLEIREVSLLTSSDCC